jgi:hypothetical protein
VEDGIEGEQHLGDERTVLFPQHIVDFPLAPLFVEIGDVGHVVQQRLLLRIVEQLRSDGVPHAFAEQAAVQRLIPMDAIEKIRGLRCKFFPLRRRQKSRALVLHADCIARHERPARMFYPFLGASRDTVDAT